MASPDGFARDPEHWLRRFSPEEWIRAGLSELEAVEEAMAGRNATAARAGLKRAAGMALNGALLVVPNEAWGRTYVEHLRAVAGDASIPEPVRAAARRIAELNLPGSELISLRTKSEDAELLEAAKTVMAHAYAVVHGSVGRS